MQTHFSQRFEAWKQRRDARWLQRWQTQRNHPLRLIFMRGIVLWALPIIALTQLMIVTQVPDEVSSRWPEAMWVISATVLLGGIVFGGAQYLIAEYHFRKMRRGSAAV